MQIFLSQENGDKLFVIAIENVKVMRNAKILELKAIIKRSFGQESGPVTSR